MRPTFPGVALGRPKRYVCKLVYSACGLKDFPLGSLRCYKQKLSYGSHALGFDGSHARMGI